MNEFRDILRFAGQRGDEPLALATLVRSTGSSYRRPGARMLVTADREMIGSLSAGCLEDEVATAAQEVLATGEPRLMFFDTRRRFGCDGSIEIFVERVAKDLLDFLAREMEGRTPTMLETVFENSIAPHATRILTSVHDATPGAFVQNIEPPNRLLVVGSGPDSIALLMQAQLLGWETLALESIADCDVELDAWTVAVVATHNYGRDCAALRHLLPLDLRYLGVIGPRRRRDELLSDVLDSGAHLVSNLFAPAGLHLGADSPGEIALSIVAEIQMVLTNTSAVSLRERRAPIHAPVRVAAKIAS